MWCQVPSCSRRRLRRRRYFRLAGYHVQYFTSQTGKCTGGFDLRKVIYLRPSEDPQVQTGVDIVFDDSTKMIISFAEVCFAHHRASGSSATCCVRTCAPLKF